MKKVLIILISLILIVLLLYVLLWFYPVVHAIPQIGFTIEQYSNDGKIAFLCEAGGNTGPDWKIKEHAGISSSPEYIDIAGNTPDSILKFPFYIYRNNTFLFIGNFKQNNDLFYVDEWYFVGDIERIHLIAPYPKSVLNYYEIKNNG